MKAKFFLITLAFMLPVAVNAADSGETTPADSVSVEKKRNLIGKIVDYFAEANKVHRSKGIDFSIIGGPHYSSDTKFGIGLVAAGLYYNNINDSILPPSNMSIYFDATTSLFFKLGVRGTHIFTDDSRRFNYDISFSSVTTKFWGIGYYNNKYDGNESKYKYLNSQARLDFSWRLCDGLYLGYRAYFAKELYVSSAAAFEAAIVGSVPLSIVEQLIRGNIEVAMFFIHELSKNLGGSDTKIVNLTQKHIRGRLAEALLILLDNYGLEDDGSTLKIYMSREDLANLSNMTTSNAIRTLTSFVNERLIIVDGRRIKIINEPMLRKISKFG